MKVYSSVIHKGGVGKTAVNCQLAFYLAIKRGLRVLFIDLDHQMNATSVMRESGLALMSQTTAGQLLNEARTEIDTGSFVAVPGDKDLLPKLEQQPVRRNEFATNLRNFINSVDSQFDVCVIDCNPSADIRQLSALVVCDYVVGPIQLMQESIDGIADLLGHPSLGVRKIQATVNPQLVFLGLLPNMVKATPFQKENMRDVVKHYRDLLIPTPEAINFAHIKDSTAVSEAQSAGCPIWTLKGADGKPKTSARRTWAELEPVFLKLTELMEVPHGTA